MRKRQRPLEAPPTKGELAAAMALYFVIAVATIWLAGNLAEWIFG